MTHYSPREYRQLKKGAKEFARSVQAGRTYYVAQHISGPKGDTFVSEIQFKRRFAAGLMWGSFSPEKLYVLTGGEIYDDRDHPKIRSHRTWVEQAEFEAKFEAAFLSGKGHYERLEQETRGTGFAVTW